MEDSLPFLIGVCLLILVGVGVLSVNEFRKKSKTRVKTDSDVQQKQP